MKMRTVNYTAIGVPLLVCVSAAVLSLQWWFAYNPTSDFSVSMPGADGRPPGTFGSMETVDLQGIFETFDGVPADLPGSWTRFRGPDFDNIVKGGEPLAESWSEGGPEIFWSVDLGEGHAAPVVQNGRVYLMDYDEDTRSDSLRCFSLADGREIWRRSYALSMKRNHGLSRTIPAVTANYIVTMGPRCHVSCLDPESGDFLWGIDLQKKYGTTEPLWYTGQCPLIDNGMAIIAQGGPDVLMMGVECETGRVMWKTPNTDGWNMSHSSIIPMDYGGTSFYLYCAVGGMVCVFADGDRAGEIAWSVPWKPAVVAPSPVPLGDGRIFMTAGYGNGSMMVNVTEQNGSFSAEKLWEKEPSEGLACEQQTPIYHNGLLYGVMPKDGGALRLQFVCYRPDGSLVWSSGQTKRFGLGPFLLADGKFFVLSDEGVLTVLDAGRDKYVELAQTRVLDGHDAWGPIAVAGRRMLLRDSVRMVCIDVGAGG